MFVVAVTAYAGPVRLWSLHPRYLDPAGLVALWREGLLGQAVLAGATRGYTRHPQLIRFREHSDPCRAMGAYLHHIADEADRRGYRFDRARIAFRQTDAALTVSRGQLLYEWQHLKRKLRVRSPAHYRRALLEARPAAHPCFRVIPGGVADWEVRTPASRAPRRSSPGDRARR
jgi:hypothetical protein